MAQPPSVRRLLVEDFPAEQQEWIGDLLQVLNQFMDQTSNALSSNVTLKENSLAVVREIDFKGNATITGNITSGSNSMTNVNSTYSLAVNQPIAGPGIPSNTKISAIAGSTITLSQNATSTIVGVPTIVGNNFPVNFLYTLPTRPISLRIGQIYENTDNPLVIALPTSVDWEYLNGQIIINHITGLRADVKYRATIIIEGE